VQAEESGARKQRHGDEEQPGVALPSRDLTGEKTQPDVEQRRREHEPEMHRIVVIHDVQSRLGKQQCETSNRHEQ
jgi:hypothetical protein